MGQGSIQSQLTGGRSANLMPLLFMINVLTKDVHHRDHMPVSRSLIRCLLGRFSTSEYAFGMTPNEHLERHLDLCKAVFEDLKASGKWLWPDSQLSEDLVEFEDNSDIA